MVEPSPLKATTVEASTVEATAIHRADDGLATIERLVPLEAMPMVTASLNVNGCHVLKSVTEATSVETIVFGIPDGSARDTTDQTADRRTGDRSIATSTDQPTDDGTGDRSVASPALGKVLGLDVRYHHENGGDCEGSVFDHVHCFDFRGRFFRGNASE